MSETDRPTREQGDAEPRYSRALVDEALVHTDELADWSAKVDRQILAAEVRALRAELDTARVASEQIAEWRSAEHVELVRLRAVEAAARKYIAGGLHDEFMAALGIQGYGDAGGGVARTPQPAEPSTGDLLRAAAAGRREYAGKGDVPGADDLLAEAATLECAAQVADGDMGPLYGWLPSWRWTPEMDRRVLSSTSASTSPTDAADLPFAPSDVLAAHAVTKLRKYAEEHEDDEIEALLAEYARRGAELNDPRAGKKDRARWAAWLDLSADEADDLSDGERLGLRIAATHLLDVSVAARVSESEVNSGSIRVLYNRVWAKVERGRAALVARTQPAEPAQCSSCDGTEWACYACQAPHEGWLYEAPRAPLPAVPDGEDACA